jgi:hypothetical protein
MRGTRGPGAVATMEGRGRGRGRIAGAGVGVLLLLTSCAAFAEDDATSTREDIERETREEGDVEGAIGDELEVYDLTVTVSEVERVAEFGEMDNRGYIVATVSMTNDSGGSIDFDRSDWRIEKPDGTVANTANVSTEPQLQDDTIPDGETIEGRVIFTVGDAEGQFAVLFVSASMRPEDELALERGVWVFDSAPGDAG